MKNKKWFTLLETLLALVVISMFIGTIIMIYISIRWADWKMKNKRILTAEASDLIDIIHDAAIDYTIDYEEYFNLKWLWITEPSKNFSSYWNSWSLYYCWIDQGRQWKYWVYQRNWSDGWCEVTHDHLNQQYLEYYFQHRKITDSANLNSKANSGTFQWMWPVAISPNTWLDYLYLINWNWDERYYFRRIYVTWIDLNHDWLTWINEELYKVQMLKLKWYDAWVWHDFETRWAYDWFIDTRACDKSKWFNCTGQIVENWSQLPIDENDWRIDITSDRVTVSDMKIDIYPIKDPYLVINEEEYKIDPYAKISFTMNIYWEESNDEITLSTTLWFKNSYRRFPVIEYTWYIAEEK